MNILIANQPLQLLSDAAAFDHELQTLFVADLHLGKTAVFREAGIALPHGPDAVILDRLSQLISVTGANKLVILGDVFHARTTGIQPVLDLISQWRAAHSYVKWLVVPGNHDRFVSWNEWLPGAEVVPSGSVLGQWRIAHHPPVMAENPTLCGHLHPGVSIGRRSERRLRVPCFWMRRNVLIFPAFGEFTGLQIIDRESDDQVWVASAGKIVELPPPSHGYRPANFNA